MNSNRAVQLKAGRGWVVSTLLYFYLTVIGDYINTMKTTLEFNFYFYQSVKHTDTHKHRSQEKLSIKKASV